MIPGFLLSHLLPPLPPGMPKSDAKDGYTTYGNFVGPGWNRNGFRTRPVDNFDFAAKMHDLAYCLNDMSYSKGEALQKKMMKLLNKEAGTYTSNRDLLTAEEIAKIKKMIVENQPKWKMAEYQQYLADLDYLSRLAKADYIFFVMNDHTKEKGFQYNYAKRNFVRKEWIVAGDKYINAFRHTTVLMVLSNPDQYLMIPYSALKNRPRLQNEQQKDVPDYQAKADEDTKPGFLGWAQQQYGPVWAKLVALDANTKEVK